MNLKTRFKVGDVLTNEVWGANAEYLVLDVKETSLMLRRESTGWEGYYGPYESELADIVVARNELIKTPVERKIAFMRKRFEERNNAQTQSW